LWARVATSPIVGEDGDFEGALSMVSDITEQKRSEAEACGSRQMISLLSLAVEQTADSAVITDREGTIECVNPAFEATTGYRREEAVGKTPRILKSALHDKEFYSRLWGQIPSDPIRSACHRIRRFRLPAPEVISEEGTLASATAL
jgi:PAS domain-containing protein